MRNIFLIFRRDYLGYVKAWGFWLSLAAVPMFMIIGGLLGMYAATSSPVRYYAVIETGSTFSDAIENEFARGEADEAKQAAEMLDGMNIAPDMSESEKAEMLTSDEDRKFIRVAPPARDIDALRPYLFGEQLVDGPDGPKPLFAAFIASRDGKTLEYWSADVNVGGLRSTARTAMRTLAREQALGEAGLDAGFLERVDAAATEVPARRIRTVEEQATAGNEVTTADKAPLWVAGGLAYFLWLMIFSIIQYLLMGTIEERSNKIFDTLLTSVKLPQLLAGKLLAVFAVTSTMMVSWGLFAGIGTMVAASAVPGSEGMFSPFIGALLDPALIIPGLISFVLGYIMYGAIFMALGSLCDTIQEAQTLLSPMMILLMLPMFAIMIAFQDPGSPVVDIAAWIPIFTPFLLILRMPHDPPMWEVMAQLGLMAVTATLIMWLAAKVYRAGAVHGAGIGDAGAMFKRALGLKPKVKAS